MEALQLTVGDDTLHHIGLVVRSVPEAAERFVAGLRLCWDGRVFHDAIQSARVAFLSPGVPSAPRIELVEPASQESHLVRFLKRGGGLHHLCYEVNSLDAQLEIALSAGAILVREPAPAVAFGGRRIAWTCMPELLLVEYLERSKLRGHTE